MPAAKKNLTIDQYATFTLPLRYLTASKQPVNLTGFKAHMSIRQATGQLLSDLTTENGKITIDVPTGTITMEIPASETGAMASGTGYYDFVLIDALGRKKRLLEGLVTLRPGQSQ